MSSSDWGPIAASSHLRTHVVAVISAVRLFVGVRSLGFELEGC